MVQRLDQHLAEVAQGADPPDTREVRLEALVNARNSAEYAAFMDMAEGELRGCFNTFLNGKDAREVEEARAMGRAISVIIERMDTAAGIWDYNKLIARMSQETRMDKERLREALASRHQGVEGLADHRDAMRDAAVSDTGM